MPSAFSTGSTTTWWSWNKDISRKIKGKLISWAKLLFGDWFYLSINWHWHSCSQVTLVRLCPSDSSAIIPKLNCYYCSQVTLARLIQSETGAIVTKWKWHDCSQVTLERLFQVDTGTIVYKWDWHNCSQVTLARLFPSDTGMIVPKWHWHDRSQVTLAPLLPSGFWLSNLYFVLQFVFWHDSSLLSFTREELRHVPEL